MIQANEVLEMINQLGYTNVTIDTCFTNGISHYAKLDVDVIDEGKCFADMFISDNKKAYITIRISNHSSGLEKNCGGICGNKMTLYNFKRLRHSGAIKKFN